MRNFVSGRSVVVGAVAVLMCAAGADSAMADGPRPYAIGVTDLQGETDWSGFYIGGRLGGAWSDLSWSQSPSPFTLGGAVPLGSSASFSPSGVEGGIFGGGNVQVGHWVFG